MTPGSGRFRRGDRLRSSKDFRRVSREGARRSSEHFVLLTAPGFTGDPAAQPRLGITVSRKVGGAVTRTRVKRGIREWFRVDREAIPRGLDVVVIARRGAADLSGQQLRAELVGLFR